MESKQTAVEMLIEQIANYVDFPAEPTGITKLIDKAKAMEKEKHQKFNKYLNDEKELGISDLKTIERIQWYYNTYFNETYG
jgi:hypothetical protein